MGNGFQLRASQNKKFREELGPEKKCAGKGQPVGPVVLVTIFHCLRFETSFFVASYDSKGYGGGIRPRLHTGLTSC
jgi:hypothetical protein